MTTDAFVIMLLALLGGFGLLALVVAGVEHLHSRARKRNGGDGHG